MTYYYNPIPVGSLPLGSEVKATDEYTAVDTTVTPNGVTNKYTIEQFVDFLQLNFGSNYKSTVIATTISNLNAVYVNGPDNDGVGATLTNADTPAYFVADGYQPSQGDRVLVTFQTNAYENGIYVLTTQSNSEPWVLTRAEDYNGSAAHPILQGDIVGVLFGQNYTLTSWMQQAQDVVNVGTDPITFATRTVLFQEFWINQTLPTATLAINTGYVCAAGANLITFTLPTTSPFGAYLKIVGKDIGLFTIAQNAGQTIHFGNVSTTTGVGGTLSSQQRYDSLSLVCVTADTEWSVTSSQGNFTLV